MSFNMSVSQRVNSEVLTCIVCTKMEPGASKAVTEDKQQAIL